MLLIAVNGYQNKKLQSLNRGTIIFTSLLSFYVSFSSLMHWPYYVEFTLISLVPIVPYLLLILKDKMGKNELGYLTIINSVALVHFLRYNLLSEASLFNGIYILVFLMMLYLILGLIFSKRKSFFKWNSIFFTVYSVVIVWLIYDPEADSYGQALAAFSYGTLIFFTPLLGCSGFKPILFLQ